MANKLKKSNPPKAAAEKPVKSEKQKTSSPDKFLKEREEKVDLKKLANDERTWKIIGAVSLLVAVFLLVSFVSYLFTWREDQSQVMNTTFWDLFRPSSEASVANLFGRLGAFVSHTIIFKGFGLASFLFCTFFFVVGTNLLFDRKVFSVRRNLKYVTIGLVIASVVFAFVLPDASDSFPYGGGVGNLMNDWLVGLLGKVGTAALLLVLGFSYFIWQFNPSFKLPEKRKELVVDETGEIKEADVQPDVFAPSINDLYANAAQQAPGNSLKGEGGMVFQLNDEDSESSFTIIEKDEPVDPIPADDAIASEIQDDILHNRDISVVENEELINESNLSDPSDVELEIKAVDPGIEEPNVAPKKLHVKTQTLNASQFLFPHLELLKTHGSEKIILDQEELIAHKNQIETTLKHYDIEISKITATVGPTVTLYEIIPKPGVRISRIKNLEDDIALSLAALGIRIIAPIPGKGTIGIEVPNVKKTIVSMKTLLASEKFTNTNYSLPIAIGKKIDNENFIVDLASMPHLLMAGATGQGKSVGINTILISLLYKKTPTELKFVLIDPKKVELSIYSKIQKYYLAKLPNEEDAIITDTSKVIYTLKALCDVMDQRYNLLKEAGTRNIKEYNDKVLSGKLRNDHDEYLPFIVLIIDEFADLIMTAGKEIETPISRLAQLARAVGIHLVIATQRPSVNIITGTIKANFPSRVAFKVASKIDSRTILDAGGAEQLIGKGDMLISHHGELTRLQCAFVDTEEVEQVVDFIADQKLNIEPFELPLIEESKKEAIKPGNEELDPLFRDAARLIVEHQQGSTSLLQRRMKLGYNRAGRLMDQLELAGIVGPNQGSKAREVLIKTEADLDDCLQNLS